MDEQLEANKKIIREWHDLIIRQHRPEDAAAKYLGKEYRQHNPNAADGPEAFIGFMKWLAQTYPEFRSESKRMIAEGNYVVEHSHLILKPGERGVAVVDIYRIENGKILEHWDVVQDVPETSKNDNSMF